jgi:hypothetical protein
MRVDAGVGEWNTTHGTRWRGREWDLPGATTGDATAAILKFVDVLFHQGCWLTFRTVVGNQYGMVGGRVGEGQGQGFVVER